MDHGQTSQAKRIGFVATRVSGSDGVEAVYYRKPILCNRYAIYRTDIEPCGFNTILMDGFLTDEVVEQVRHILTDESRRQEMADHNYEVASRYFSYRRLEEELSTILAKPRLTPLCRREPG